MPVTSDILASIEIDLAIFTVVENSTLLSLSEFGLVSPQPIRHLDAVGLSLLVVTQQDGHGRRLLGDSIHSDESISQASKRIFREIFGASVNPKFRALNAFDAPGRGASNRVISFPFWAMVNFEDIRQTLGGRDRFGLELVNSREVMSEFGDESQLQAFDGVSRFGYRQMPNARLGLPHAKRLTSTLPSGRILLHDHDDMVFYAWRALRHAFDSKLDPFNYLGINPLGDEFRISDLQAFQEVCRGESISRDAFRRLMMKEDSYLRKTEVIDTKASRPGKPASLYSLARPLNTNDTSSDS